MSETPLPWRSVDRDRWLDGYDCLPFDLRPVFGLPGNHRRRDIATELARDMGMDGELSMATLVLAMQVLEQLNLRLEAGLLGDEHAARAIAAAAVSGLTIDEMVDAIVDVGGDVDIRGRVGELRRVVADALAYHLGRRVPRLLDRFRSLAA